MEYKDDIVPELLDAVNSKFKKNMNASRKAASVVKKVEAGKASYREVDQYAEEVGKALSDAFGVVSSDALPDGRMYYNIAQGLLQPTLENNHNLVSEMAAGVQNQLNSSAGIGIKAIKPELDQKHIDQLMDVATSSAVYDDVKRTVETAITTFTRKVADDAVKENFEFQSKAGLSPKIQRSSVGKCCKWCDGLVGIYDYAGVKKTGSDVYRRHANCNCIVEYIPGNGTRQNVWDKKIYTEEEATERIAMAKEIASQNTNMTANQRRLLLEERERERTLNLTSPRTFERDYETVKTHKVGHFTRNNLYIADDVDLSKRAVGMIDLQVTSAKDVMGLSDVCKAPVVIVNDDTILASYNPRTDTLYISSKMINDGEIIKLQAGFTCAEDTRSTMVHELFHWQDADEYRKDGKTIDSAEPGSVYSKFQAEKAEQGLRSAGIISAQDAARISEYAYDKILENNWEEAYTEYRTYILLAGK